MTTVTFGYLFQDPPWILHSANASVPPNAGNPISAFSETFVTPDTKAVTSVRNDSANASPSTNTGDGNNFMERNLKIVLRAGALLVSGAGVWWWKAGSIANVPAPTRDFGDVSMANESGSNEGEPHTDVVPEVDINSTDEEEESEYFSDSESNSEYYSESDEDRRFSLVRQKRSEE